LVFIRNIKKRIGFPILNYSAVDNRLYILLHKNYALAAELSAKTMFPLIKPALGGRSSYEKEVAVTKGVAAMRA
jgi:hypothetical protein